MCTARFTPQELATRKLTITTKSDRFVWEGQNVLPKKLKKYDKQEKTALTDRTNQVALPESGARQLPKKLKLVGAYFPT